MAAAHLSPAPKLDLAASLHSISLASSEDHQSSSSPSSSASSSPPSGDRPPVTRRSTDPSINTVPRVAFPHSSALHKDRLRNPSPYHRGHLRTRSAVGPHDTVPMTRTRSLPSERSSFSLSPARSSSPLRPSSSSSRASPRRSIDEGYAAAMPSFSDFEIISEDSEVDFAPRPQPAMLSMPTGMHSSTLPRGASRRRPPSPLYQQAFIPSPTQLPSPSMHSVRFNEPFPGQYSYSGSATSSLPTTPTSYRSRSPSISSLETIPDTPDVVEAEAEKEAYDLSRLRADSYATDDDRRGNGKNSRDNRRKRWSVCGAERRGDFEMETIWED